MEERPNAVYNDKNIFYSYDNFIIGSQTRTSFLYAGSCCPENAGVTLTAFDVAGNEAVCTAGNVRGPDSDVQTAGISTTLTIIIVVIVVVLVLIIIVSGVVIYVIKRKRKVELAEMRESPQAR